MSAKTNALRGLASETVTGGELYNPDNSGEDNSHDSRSLVPGNRTPLPPTTSQRVDALEGRANELEDATTNLRGSVTDLENQPSGFETAIRYAQFKIDVQKLLGLQQLTTSDEEFALETFKGLGEEFVTNFTLANLNEKQFCVSGAYQAFNQGHIQLEEVATDIAGCVANNNVDPGVV